eukprot:gene20369-27138_t
MVTAHYCTGKSEDPHASVGTIVLEDEMEFITRNAERWTQASHGVGLKFRIAETNSLSQEGKIGVSDRMAATEADGIILHMGPCKPYATSPFHCNPTKADGINLHMGPCKPYAAIASPFHCNGALGACDYCPGNSPGQTEPEPRATYYGLWFVQTAIAGLPYMAQHSVSRAPWKASSPHVKMYVFRKSSEIRIVVVQKTCRDAETFTVKLPGGYDTALFALLSSDSETPTAPFDEISYAGQTISMTGGIEGQYTPQTISATYEGSYTKYRLTLPQCSAGLLIIR